MSCLFHWVIYVSNKVYEFAGSLVLISSVNNRYVSELKKIQEWLGSKTFYWVAPPLFIRYQHRWHSENSNSCGTRWPAEYHDEREARAHYCIPDRWWAHSRWGATRQNPGNRQRVKFQSWGRYIQLGSGRWCRPGLSEQTVTTQLWFCKKDLWGFWHSIATQGLLPSSCISTTC